MESEISWIASFTVMVAAGSLVVLSGSGFGVLSQAKRASNRPRNRMDLFFIVVFVLLLATGSWLLAASIEGITSLSIKLPEARGQRPEAKLLFTLLQRLENLGSEFVGEFWVVFDEFLDRVATLGELGVAVAEPRAALLDDAHLHAEVDDFAGS